MKHLATRATRTNRILALRRLSLVLLAAAGSAMGQANAPVGTTKPAEYDCSGLEGAALTSCRQLNAGAVRGASVKADPASNPTYDCTGMSGGALATCRDLNGQWPATATDANGGGMAAGNFGYATNGSAVPLGTTGVQPATTNSATPLQGATTPITQQTTSGTNVIVPSATGATAVSGGSNAIVPSGGIPVPGVTAGTTTPATTTTTTIDATTQPAVTQVPGAPSTVAPGTGQVSPPSDRVVPAAANRAAPASVNGAAGAPAAGGGKGK